MCKYKAEIPLTFLHTAIRMMIKMMAMTTRARTVARTATCEKIAEKTQTPILFIKVMHGYIPGIYESGQNKT